MFDDSQTRSPHAVFHIFFFVRLMSSVANKYADSDDKKGTLAVTYREEIEQELTKITNEVLVRIYSNFK